eukprot:RCo033854
MGDDVDALASALEAQLAHEAKIDFSGAIRAAKEQWDLQPSLQTLFPYACILVKGPSPVDWQEGVRLLRQIKLRAASCTSPAPSHPPSSHSHANGGEAANGSHVLSPTTPPST